MRKYTEQKMLKRKFNCMCWVNQENSCYGLQAQNTPNIPLTVVLHAYSKRIGASPRKGNSATTVLVRIGPCRAVILIDTV